MVKAASRMGMLNHMSGSRGDTPLMKACAVGNDVIVELLLTHRAGFSHLGLITPPVSLVILSGLASYDFSGRGGGKAPRQLYSWWFPLVPRAPVALTKSVAPPGASLTKSVAGGGQH